MADWPKHEDGTNKRVGDMTPEEKREVFAAAAERTKKWFERPQVQSALSEALSKAGD